MLGGNQTIIYMWSLSQEFDLFLHESKTGLRFARWRMCTGIMKVGETERERGRERERERERGKIYIYTYIYVHIYTYINIHTYTYIHLYACLRLKRV